MVFSVLRPFHPILYQRSGSRKIGFERWYFKHTIPQNGLGGAGKTPRAISITPGIKRSGARGHAFIRIQDGLKDATEYFLFPASEFRFRDDPFEIRIGGNRFSLDGIDLDARNAECSVKAEIRYGDLSRPLSSLLRPSVMGSAGFLPSMECYHEIASMDHEVSGTAEIVYRKGDIETETIRFGGGRGYIEKNWGRTFPRTHFWIQTNSFDSGQAALSFSLARVEVLGKPVNALICLFSANGEEHRFTGYTRSRIDLLEYDASSIRVLVSSPTNKLELLVRRSKERFLPFQEDVSDRRGIAERLDASVRVLLKRKRGVTEDIIFDSVSNSAAVELTGELEELRP